MRRPNTFIDTTKLSLKSHVILTRTTKKRDSYLHLKNGLVRKTDNDTIMSDFRIRIFSDTVEISLISKHGEMNNLDEQISISKELISKIMAKMIELELTS